MPDVRLPSFSSSKPVSAHLVRTALASDTSSALRLSAFADPSSPAITDRRRRHIWPRSSRTPGSAFTPRRSRTSLSAQLTTSQLLGLRRFPSRALPSFPHQAPPPEPGSSPSGSRFIGLQSSRFTRAAQHPHSKRAASENAPELPSPHAPLGSLTPACSGLAALAADPRR